MGIKEYRIMSTRTSSHGNLTASTSTANDLMHDGECKYEYQSCENFDDEYLSYLNSYPTLDHCYFNIYRAWPGVRTR